MILQAKHLSKSYAPKGRNKIEILRGISLSVQENEILTIVGASGSGKTTLLNVLSTLDTADDGNIFYHNKPIFSSGKQLLKPAELATFRNKHIGFVFQFHHLLTDFNAIENVAMPKFIATGNFKEAKQDAEKLLVMVGLKERMQHFPSELSGGEQQRVAVARSLINSPSIIFADEPSGNLDSKNSDKLYELISDLSRSHKTTFIIVTHNNRYAALSDRCLQMNDGILNDVAPTL
ncbi:ABC transporter-related protein [Chloroherpeton thalassium ATCC 35110]|uniref:ABC transporter-related protein n=1 Tax=Chloroherpeton thalassium (strain ATCC 35110 / GB-78) TaxID=517418 RepID=B3QXK3_CHLT3|nr:ABC transporter-related protein [Chloroherpeton thalassium ATCC 35110]